MSLSVYKNPASSAFTVNVSEVRHIIRVSNIANILFISASPPFQELR